MTPKLPKEKPIPPPPTPADPIIQGAEADAGRGYSSLVSTAPSGLVRKADTVKRSLIGGA